MKDVKVYTGSGWQSLKGPPGPSLASSDAGNTLATGSDGLLYKTREVSFDSVPPELPSGENSPNALPLLWVNTGVVHVALPERADPDPNGLGVPLDPKWQPINGPSQDPGNVIVKGSDGLLWSPPRFGGYAGLRASQPYLGLGCDGEWYIIAPPFNDADLDAEVPGMLQWSVLSNNIQDEGVLDTADDPLVFEGAPFPLDDFPTILISMHFPNGEMPPSLMGRVVDSSTIAVLIVGKDGAARPFVVRDDVPNVDAYFRVTVIQSVNRSRMP
jgi:hypothetical protein